MRVKSVPTRNKHMKSFIKSFTDVEFDDSAVEKLCCEEYIFIKDLLKEVKYVENETGKKQTNFRMASLLVGGFSLQKK